MNKKILVLLPLLAFMSCNKSDSGSSSSPISIPEVAKLPETSLPSTPNTDSAVLAPKPCGNIDVKISKLVDLDCRIKFVDSTSAERVIEDEKSDENSLPSDIGFDLMGMSIEVTPSSRKFQFSLVNSTNKMNLKASSSYPGNDPQRMIINFYNCLSNPKELCKDFNEDKQIITTIENSLFAPGSTIVDKAKLNQLAMISAQSHMTETIECTYSQDASGKTLIQISEEDSLFCENHFKNFPQTTRDIKPGTKPKYSAKYQYEADAENVSFK